MTMAARLRATAVWLLIAASLCVAEWARGASGFRHHRREHSLEQTVATLADRTGPRCRVRHSSASDPKECVWRHATLATVPDLSVAGSHVVAKRKIASAPLPCSRMVVLARWAAITDQRRDVLDLRRGDVLRILRGEASDWSEFGGSPQPISVYLSSVAGRRDRGRARPLAQRTGGRLCCRTSELTDRVEATPGAFALDRARAAAARGTRAHGQWLRSVPRPGAAVTAASAGLGARAHVRGRHRAAGGGGDHRSRRRSTRREWWSPAS